jgi:histone-lysine N-methyltransferase SETD1
LNALFVLHFSFQFFGFGIDVIRRALEGMSGIEAAAVPLTSESTPYEFCFVHPDMDDMTALQRRRAVVASEKTLENETGCARTEGMMAVTKSGGSGRITRALLRSGADNDAAASSSAQGQGGRSNSKLMTRGVIEEQVGLKAKDQESIQAKYDEMKSQPLESRLAAKRSHIHGWGLFTKRDFAKHSMLIEYMGEAVRQIIADKRERAYEMEGLGSCYMFRLDQKRIVDATMIGCMARFMNHCCQPNAYAKIVNVETDMGLGRSAAEKKIVVFALRDIAAGEEITYDYKFPVEDGSLKCTCGAPNCIGTMN